MSVKIGSSDVGVVGLGTAGLAFGESSREQGVDVIRAAVDAGIILIDAALAYTRVGAESYVETVVAGAARAIGRDALFIVTKGGHWRDGDTFPVDGRPATLRQHCDISLRNLGVDVIDLYLLHHVDPGVPIEESSGALQELRTAGKVRTIGLSNVDSGLVDRALTSGPIDAVQNRLSLADPGDLDFARRCQELGIAYLAYQPLGGRGAETTLAVKKVASRLAVSPQQVLIAWLIAQGPNILPIAGATRPETARDSAAAARLALTTTDIAEVTR